MDHLHIAGEVNTDLRDVEIDIYAIAAATQQVSDSGSLWGKSFAYVKGLRKVQHGLEKDGTLDENETRVSPSARSLLGSAVSEDTAAIKWTFSGTVKGSATVGSSSSGEHAMNVIFKFDTADDSWSLGADYSFHMEGISITLAGTAVSKCTPDVPTTLDGSMELSLPSVAMITSISARHWCEENAAVRIEANASVPNLSILDGRVEIVDVHITWRAIPGMNGQPYGTPLSKLRHEGHVHGQVATNFDINSPGVTLGITASVELTLLYVPGEQYVAANASDTDGAQASSVRVLDPVVDMRAYLIVNGSMGEGQPPMLEASLSGRFAPAREEPVNAMGNGTIRFPGINAGDDPAELNVRFAAYMWCSHISRAVSNGRVLEFSASLDSGGGSIYGLKVNKLSATGTFISPTDSLESVRLEDEDVVGLEDDDGSAAEDADEENAASPEVIKKSGDVSTGGTQGAFPALVFDLKGTSGSIDVYADVSFDTGQLDASNTSAMLDGADASARAVWKGTIARNAGLHEEWKVIESHITVAASITYTSPEFSVDLRANGSAVCDKSPDALPWKLTGKMRVPPLELELLLAASYRCGPRELTADVNVTELSVNLGGGFTLNARDVSVGLEANITRFPGDSGIEGNDAVLGQAPATASASNSGGQDAEIDWRLKASGEISIIKGTDGMPNIDARALVSVVLGNFGDGKQISSSA